MNLYQVADAQYEWCCFVFDVSRNRAKASAAEYFGCDYIDMRCKTLKKGLQSVQIPTIVDSDADEEYKVVLECGYRYYDEEELAAMIDEWMNEPLFREKDRKDDGNG